MGPGTTVTARPGGSAHADTAEQLSSASLLVLNLYSMGCAAAIGQRALLRYHYVPPSHEPSARLVGAQDSLCPVPCDMPDHAFDGRVHSSSQKLHVGVGIRKAPEDFIGKGLADYLLFSKWLAARPNKP
jgi:hypothetical protein